MKSGGPFAKPFTGNFGLRAEFGINKPSFYDYALLHKLGTGRIANAAQNVIATRAADGSLVLAVWNILDPAENNQPPAKGKPLTMDLALSGVAPEAAVTIERVDDEHGNVLPKYRAMGAPNYPTAAQVKQLNDAAALPPPEATKLKGGHLVLTLEPNALLVVRVGR